ncbi:hypothetical protein [Hymenobacter cheonanensis]|uniref:hypothetical protein n=1 Tax=Hymenobacter sp. CA2-7 TaxID=3063993 RepID=UPI002713038E|nr:hypothetical protein [Hymenobacter sp. CA2-7]MDO7886391.1 hypothetical protein [Hymenobacter sp. CA2-7]
MTRATLLQLLAHPTALTGADVRALEQLAEAFPYCQTAHLLLAKAAHDQGSMLAGQRLRRAATYAADRTRLRQLIELPAPAEQLAPPVAVEAQADAGTSSQLPAAALAHVSEPLAEQELFAANEQVAASPTALLEDKPDQVIEPLAPEPAPVLSPAPEAAAQPEPTPAAPQPEAEIETELPPQAPPIRPPAEAEVARFEFGLAPEEPAEIMAYRLPGLEEASAPALITSAPATPLLPAFNGLADVCYAPSEGSRLGFGLVAAASSEAIPGASLPPADEFFAPDALLLAHLAVHQAPAQPKPSSLDLINSFLQRAPAPTRRRTAPLPSAPEPDAQADLSVRSTRAEPDLASESLAKILARQGKIDRAIAVYERLMVKQPEKMAYFVAQIESLRPSA